MRRPMRNIRSKLRTACFFVIEISCLLLRADIDAEPELDENWGVLNDSDAEIDDDNCLEDEGNESEDDD